MTFPIPEKRHKRFEELAYGMFIHWGLYSQLGQGEWVQHNRNIPMEEYVKLKDSFTADEFDAGKIASIARDAGMKYIVLTTRHHEGFSLYDTCGLSDFDAMHSPAGRDLVREFVDGCRAENIVPFFYHTTLDWHQKSYEDDFDTYLNYLRESIEILCTQYGEIGGLWFDGNWNKPNADWKESNLYETIRKYQPDAMIINNTGLSARGKAGHKELDCVTFEQGHPAQLNRENMSKYLCSEMCQTMNAHWGIGNDDFSYLSPKEVIKNICACRKVGANYLLNVGPTAEGKIPEYEESVLRRVGKWVNYYDEAIYHGKRSPITGNGSDFALEADGKTFIFISNLAIEGHSDVTVSVEGQGPRVFGNVRRKVSGVRWVDNNEELAFSHDSTSGLLAFKATGYPYGVNMVIRVAEVY